MKFIQDYWPMMALALWFGYKWWNARRVKALLPQLKSEGAILLDVRSEAEFASGNAPGTRNIPLNELGQHLASLPKSAPVVVGCASGTRSARTAPGGGRARCRATCRNTTTRRGHDPAPPWRT